MNVIIDEEFKSVMFKLRQDEYDGLEQSIIDDGCRDPLVVWGDILVDGYNRYDICQKHDVEFNTVQKQFDSRQEAKNWIRKNQFGKRNLTVEQRNYLIGQDYKERKLSIGRPEGGKSYQNDNLKTHQKIANEYKISEASVPRAEKFADAVDTIAENTDNDVRDEILSRELDATQDDVKALAKQNKDVQKKAVEKARSGMNLKKAIREAVKESRVEVETPHIPKGKYNVIVIDPPWQYSNAGLGGAAERHYATLSLEARIGDTLFCVAPFRAFPPQKKRVGVMKFGEPVDA